MKWFGQLQGLDSNPLGLSIKDIDSGSARNRKSCPKALPHPPLAGSQFGGTDSLHSYPRKTNIKPKRILCLFAGPPGIEPGTSGFGDRHSPKLNYGPLFLPLFMQSMLSAPLAEFFQF